MSGNNNFPTSTSTIDSVKHSAPIPIGIHTRHRSGSLSSDSSNSPNSPPPVQTPLSRNPPRISTSPSSSPILYFLSQSPTKAPATFPFRGFGPPVFEEEPEELPSAGHARRASIAGRFAPPTQQQAPPMPEGNEGRGVSLFRRLSLGGALAKPPADVPRTRSPPRPATPPNTAISSPVATRNIPQPSPRKPRRSATVSYERPKRAPSPMGERILKGHFDGFN